MASKEIPRSTPIPCSPRAPENNPTPAIANANATPPAPASSGDATGQTPVTSSAPSAANPAVDKALLQWELVKNRQGRPESALSRSQRDILARLQGKKGASNPSVSTTPSCASATKKKKKKSAKVASQPGAAAPAEASSSRAATTATAAGVPDGSPSPTQTTLHAPSGSVVKGTPAATGHVSPPPKPLRFKPYIPKRPADSDSELADRSRTTTRKKARTSKSAASAATPQAATAPLTEAASVGSSAKGKGKARKKTEPAATIGDQDAPKKTTCPRTGSSRTAKDPAPAMASSRRDVPSDSELSLVKLPQPGFLDVAPTSVPTAGIVSSLATEPVLPPHDGEAIDADRLTNALIAEESKNGIAAPADPASEDWLADALCEGNDDPAQASSAPAGVDFLADELSEASDDHAANASTVSSTLAGDSPSATASTSVASSRTSCSPAGILLPLGAVPTPLKDGPETLEDVHVAKKPSADGEEDEESSYCSLFGSDDALFS